MNRRTWPELAELFLSDAPVVVDLRDREPMEFSGPDAIGEFIAGAIERFPFFEFVALNVRVLRDGDPDRARVRTYMCELRQDHDGTPSRAFGLYQDDVVRDAGRLAVRPPSLPVDRTRRAGARPHAAARDLLTRR